MIQLVDDRILSGILRGEPPPDPAAQVFTTGLWYTRFCQAVLASATIRGTLSGPFSALRGPARERAVRSLLELPDDIGLVSLRALGPAIGQLRQRHNLNILGMEALAAAHEMRADTYLSAPSPRLMSALHAEDLRAIPHP